MQPPPLPPSRSPLAPLPGSLWEPVGGGVVPLSLRGLELWRWQLGQVSSTPAGWWGQKVALPTGVAQAMGRDSEAFSVLLLWARPLSLPPLWQWETPSLSDPDPSSQKLCQSRGKEGGHSGQLLGFQLGWLNQQAPGKPPPLPVECWAPWLALSQSPTGFFSGKSWGKRGFLPSGSSEASGN